MSIMSILAIEWTCLDGDQSVTSNHRSTTFHCVVRIDRIRIKIHTNH
jgi:hypothetical protein